MPLELKEFCNLGNINKAGLLLKYYYLKYAINLKKKKMPSFNPIYLLNKKEQQAF
jgi:hypothetical protein